MVCSNQYSVINYLLVTYKATKQLLQISGKFFDCGHREVTEVINKLHFMSVTCARKNVRSTLKRRTVLEQIPSLLTNHTITHVSS